MHQQDGKKAHKVKQGPENELSFKPYKFTVHHVSVVALKVEEQGAQRVTCHQDSEQEVDRLEDLLQSTSVQNWSKLLIKNYVGSNQTESQNRINSATDPSESRHVCDKCTHVTIELIRRAVTSVQNLQRANKKHWL